MIDFLVLIFKKPKCLIIVAAIIGIVGRADALKATSLIFGRVPNANKTATTTTTTSTTVATSDADPLIDEEVCIISLLMTFVKMICALTKIDLIWMKPINQRAHPLNVSTIYHWFDGLLNETAMTEVDNEPNHNSSESQPLAISHWMQLRSHYINTIGGAAKCECRSNLVRHPGLAPFRLVSTNLCIFTKRTFTSDVVFGAKSPA